MLKVRWARIDVGEGCLMSETNVPRAFIRLGKRRIPVPRRKRARVALGLWFTIGGALPFPPGFMFIPVGLTILSIDFPTLRRWRRRSTVWVGRRRKNKKDA